MEYELKRREQSTALEWNNLCILGGAAVYYAWDERTNVGTRADKLAEYRMHLATERGCKRREKKHQETIAEPWLKSIPQANGDWGGWTRTDETFDRASRSTTWTLRVLMQARDARSALNDYIVLKTSNPTQYSPRMTSR